MTGLNSAVSNALTGLDVFSQGINTVSNNITNQSASGYAVETVDPQTAGNGGGSAAGSGVVDPALVQRAADSFAAVGVYKATATNSAATTLSSALSAIDQSLSGNGNIHGAASTLFADLNSLASTPTNSAQLSAVLSDVQNLAGTFNSAAGSLQEQYSQIGTSLGQQVKQVNTLIGRLATINKQLQASPNQSSLLDQQQAALTQLSSYMAIQTVPLGSSGAVAVLTGGTVLVDQAGSESISVHQPQPSSLPTLTAGKSNDPISLSSTGGSIGGLLAGFAATISANNQIDWYAGAVSGLINQAQAEGLNGSGTPGKPLLSIPGPTVSPSSSNTGSATLTPTITNAASLPSNGQGYSLTYTGSGWTATVPGTNTTFSLGATSPLTLNGMSVAVTGTPAPGDTFLIKPTPGAASAIATTTTNPSAIAAADPYLVTAGTVSSSGVVTNNNAGTISEGSDQVVSTPTTGAAVVGPGSFGSNLQIKFTSPNAYNILSPSGTTLATGSFTNGSSTIAIEYPSPGLAAGQYWQVQINGNPATGDVATLQTGAGLNSGSNAQRMSNLWTQANSNLPGDSLQGSILSIVGTTGAQSAQAKALSQNSAANLTTAQSNLAQVAGVNQDQQATALTQYEQAYQAAAKVITTAMTMFNSLLQAV
jgi:flagellar hook-associated protein 1 FlgK